ncbi:fructosamine kinase family protein [Salinivibrio sp. EAGSL]|uniref:fructosamine kinase family protein n=1 Tax=Salinivibrio sp. EAGSL TaxID=2738468 RepID=UPI00158DE297|nr:fructosamine kinase family protein [Salinivibrio sp. EAGSL]NUY55063.1 fructosamine kinase family protein [Salinivibrio sp. EAGSL]
MWHALSLHLSEQLDIDFEIREKTAIGGGDIHDAYCISDGGEQRFFVKINQRECLPAFEAEAEGLRQLAMSEHIHVPRVYFVGPVKDNAALVLNFLPIKSLDDTQAYLFGQQLARHHRWGEQVEYGFDDDNFIGTSEQRNSWHRKWCHFFAEQRIGWQLQLAAEKSLHLGDIDTIIHGVKAQLANHRPKPALLHGDLWSGNVGLSVKGPVLFDPACYWGDREADIAMTELFGGFPQSFYNGYQAEWPLDEGYQQRKDIYNLYHVLNHVNLFGGPYLAQAEQLLTKLTLTV